MTASPSGGVPITNVTGGAGGFEANYDDLLWLADQFAQHAWQMTGKAALGARVVSNPDLVESGLLAPDTFAEAEATMAVASTGFEGLTLRALQLEADALLIRGTVAAYIACDAFVHDLLPRLEAEAGYVAGKATVAAVGSDPLLSVAVGGSAYLTWVLVPDQVKAEASRELLEELHANPVLAEHVIAAGGGFVGGLYDATVGSTPGAAVGLEWLTGYDLPDGEVGALTTSEAAQHLARMFGDDTDYRVSEHPVAGLTPAPRDLPAVIDRLTDVNERGEGEIEIQRLSGGRAIVYLPGTDDLNPLPPGDSTARDMETNYQSVGQLNSAYQRGIVDAMRKAGLDDATSVMLVGHSQGGMVAAQIAADPALSSEFSIKQVMTAGSATGMVDDLPSDVRMLNLRNRGDLVPMLDGEGDPDQANRLTVTFDAGPGTLNQMHSLESYRQGAAALERSRHHSVTTMLDDLQRDGFVGGHTESVRTFTISRPTGGR